MPLQRSNLQSINISIKRRKAIQQRLIEWGRTNYSDYPWRRTRNLEYGLIAEVMLQRTRADQVEKVYNHFTSAYYTISQASKQDEETLLELFKPLGLNWRNKKLVELIHYLSEHELPTTKEELIKLPGVGNYSANAFISFHLGKKAPITDSNAVRLWSRIFGFDTDSEMHKKKTFNNFVEKITPETEYKDFNYAVLDLTRDICKRNPQCTICPLNQICIYYQEKTKS